MSTEQKKFVLISEHLSTMFADNLDEWKDSPFRWIKNKSSRTIGSIGEQFILSWLRDHGFFMQKSKNTESDLILNGKKIEVKLSTKWKNGVYKFQQIRNQDYDILICLGISPHQIHVWVIPKEDVIRLWKIEKKILSQHLGNDGSETAWLDVPTDKFPDWIEQFGGTPEKALEVLRNIINE